MAALKFRLRGLSFCRPGDPTQDLIHVKHMFTIELYLNPIMLPDWGGEDHVCPADVPSPQMSFPFIADPVCLESAVPTSAV